MKSFPFTPNLLLRKGKPAFTLVELLAVITIIGLLLAATAPLISNMAYGGRYTKSLIQISGALEKAREYSIAHQAHVYVALSDRDVNGQMFMGIISASDGSQGGVQDLAEAKKYAVSNSNSPPLILLDRLEVLEGCALEDKIPAGNALASNTQLTPESAVAFLTIDGAEFTYQRPNGTVSFTRAIHFTPRGEGKVSRAIPQAVQIVLTPLKGISVRDTAGASAIQITGLTGQVTVYRP